MDEEVVVDELLNGKVGGDGEEVPGHYVADADAVKCFSHLGLPEASLRAGTDEPPEEDYPYAIDNFICVQYDERESCDDHEQREYLTGRRRLSRRLQATS